MQGGMPQGAQPMAMDGTPLRSESDWIQYAMRYQAAQQQGTME